MRKERGGALSWRSIDQSFLNVMPQTMAEHTYRRIDLAKEQLEVALSLFLDQRSYAAAITLAGAAEEVLGKELLRQNKQPILEWRFDRMGIFHKLLHGHELKRKEFLPLPNFEWVMRFSGGYGVSNW
jgi:hypothetical protein